MSKKRFIVGFSGLQGAGKSTLCKLIKETFILNKIEGYDLSSSLFSHTDSFATTLYDMASVFLNLPIGERVDKARSYKIGSNILTGREILQKLATEAIRNTFGQDIWVKILLQRLENKSDETKIVLIDDLRFPEEAEIIDYKIYLEADTLPVQFNNHISESYLKELSEGSDLTIRRYEVFNYEPSIEVICSKILKKQYEFEKE